MIVRDILYTSCILIGLSFSGWYYAHQHHLNQLQTPPSQSYDYFAGNVDFMQYDEAGTIDRHYHSVSLQHYKKTGITEMQVPTLTIHKPNSPVWTVSANKGRAVNDDKITLWDRVRILQKQDKTHPESLISTEYLEYYPKKQFATTDELITLKQPDSHIQSRGMRAYFAEERVLLLSATRGQYAKHPVA